MRSSYILWCIVFMAATWACKQEATTDQENASQATTQESTENQAQQPENQGQQPANPANGAKTSDGHDYTFLTDKLFHYKAAFGGEKGAQLFKDEWIDLIPDGTYKAGKLKEQTHTGKWTYNHETKILFLKPDDRAFNMSEWTVMYNNLMMVWVGTQTYGNNATQVQLTKSDVLP